MADEALRMQAIVVDKFSTPLTSLKNQMQSISGLPTLKAMSRDWAAVEKQMTGVTRELRTQLAPALSGIGIASLSVGGALAGVGLAFKNFATGTRDVAIFSRQVGLGVESLRELRAVGEHFGMGWEQTQSSLKTFAGNLDQIKRSWGAAYGALRAQNLGDVADDLKKLADAGDMKGAVDRAMQALRSIQNPQRRREVAEMLFGSDQWAVVASELTPQLRRSIRDALGEIPKGSAEAADAFALNWTKMELSVERFRNEAIGPLLPKINEVMAALNQPAVYAAVKGGFDDISKYVRESIEEYEKLKALLGWFLGGIGGGVQPLTTTDQIGSIDAQIERQKKRRDRYAPGSPDAREAEGQLGALEERRRELLKKGVKEGVIEGMKDGTVQKQSLEGGGGFGGMIQSASLGGGFGGIRGGPGGMRGGGGGFGGPGGGPIVLPPAANGDGSIGGRPPGIPRVSPELPLLGGPSIGGGQQAQDPLTALIRRKEGTAGPNGYNTTLANGKLTGGPQNLTGMSLNEVDALQSRMLRHPANRWNSSAVGAYQIVRTTLRRLRRQMGLDGSEKFNEGLQDRFKDALIAGRGRSAVGLGNEWEGLKRFSNSQEILGAYDARQRMIAEGRLQPSGARSGDAMMGKAFGPGGVAAGAPKLDASGSVNIHLSGGLEKMPAQVNSEGLFKEVSINRGRQMPRTDDN